MTRIRRTGGDQPAHRQADRELCRGLSGNTLTDEKGQKAVDELVAIEQAEAGLKASYVPKLG